jgi:flavin reductase (DIM6/NTAB) family NADH-FMN oxidoreductase RutF
MRISEQIFPRSVALIGTISKEGIANLMTASFVMPVSFEPKMLAFSISPSRHTFKNLQDVPEFSLNLLEVSQKEAAAICGSNSGRNTDKFALSGINPQKSSKIAPPYADCPVSFECKVENVVEAGDHFVVIGRVLAEHAKKGDFRPLLHKGGSEYMWAQYLG